MALRIVQIKRNGVEIQVQMTEDELERAKALGQVGTVPPEPKEVGETETEVDPETGTKEEKVKPPANKGRATSTNTKE